MSASTSDGCLFINGQCVGDVSRRGITTSWSYGEFKPNDRFSGFAHLFGTWSLLMHAESTEEPLSPDARDELQQVEAQLDGLHVQLHWSQQDQWADVAAVNIDGDLIEWKAG